MASEADGITERALRAVGRTRAQGMHFYGHFVGVSGVLPGPGRARLRLEGEPPGVGLPVVSDAAFATLVDLAMGSAVRSLLEPGTRLGTVTLAVQHPTRPMHGPLEALATALPVDDRQGLVQSVVRDPSSGATVGTAQGWFMVLPAPPGVELRLMPWEHAVLPAAEVPVLAELDERERAAVAAAEAAGERAAANGTAVSRELLPFAWEACDGGLARGTLPLGPQLGNRVGHLQGGALYGAAALAAERALGAAGATLVDGHYQFLRPGDGATMLAEAQVVRRGRSASFASTDLFVDGVQVGTGQFAFRMQSDAGDGG